MKKNIIVTSVLVLFALGLLFVIQGKISFRQGRTSLFGSDTEKSDTASVAAPRYALGIGAVPLQEKDGEQVTKFSFSGDPGSEIEGKIRLVNQNTDTDLVADIYVVGSHPSSSSPSPMVRDTPGLEAGWLDIPKNVPVEKGGLKDVSFTITIPKNARPGDHALFIMVETIRLADAAQAGKNLSGQQGGVVKISSALATAVSLKVSGKEVMSAKINGLTMTSENPYTFDIAVENNGNVTVKPRITTTIESTFGTVPESALPLSAVYEILAGGTTTMVTRWDYQKMGIYTLRFTVTYGDKTEVREAKVVIYPSLVQVLIALFILLAIIAGIVYYLRRKKQDPPSMPSAQNVPPPPPPISPIQQSVPPPSVQ